MRENTRHYHPPKSLDVDGKIAHMDEKNKEVRQKYNRDEI